jgi:hypothetical protein
VILRCLDKDAEARFQGIGALAAALRPYAGANAPRLASTPEPFIVIPNSERLPAAVAFADTERGSVPSSECLQGIVATRCSPRLTTSSIPGVRSRRPLAISIAAAALVAGLFATASHRGYELGELPLDRASWSNTWTSMTTGAAQLWDDYADVGVGRRPPLPPSIPAARPAPVVELPPELRAAPARPEHKQVQDRTRVDRVRATAPLTSFRPPRQAAASVHSGAISYE